MQSPTSIFVRAAAVASVLSISACATGVRQPPRERGRITVGVTTTKGRFSTATYRVTVDPAGVAGDVKADVGLFTADDVAFGAHVVRLLDVPAQCRVEGGAERKIALSPERRFAVLRFDVRCE